MVRRKRKIMSLVMTAAMVTTLSAGMGVFASAADNELTLSESDFVNNEYTVPPNYKYVTFSEPISGKTLIVNSDVTINGGSDSTGKSNISRASDGSVSTGTPHKDLTIECHTGGVHLTLENYFASNNASSGSSTTPGGYVAPGQSLVRFTGSGNVLNIVGDVLLETTTYVSKAGIAVNSGTDLTITGTTFGNDASRLYMYKYSQGCGIGGDAGNANGNITINSGNIFIKGSKTGALIGNDAGTTSGLGDITIAGGNVNLINKAQGAAIGGSRMSYAGDVYLNGGTTTIITDFSGSAIGAGAQKKNDTSVDDPNGNLYVSGGSLKTMIMSNAYSSWGLAAGGADEQTVDSTKARYYVNDATVTANKYALTDNGDLCDASRYVVSNLSATAPFRVLVNGDLYYDNASFHGYEYTESTSNTMANWGAVTDNSLYLYLPAGGSYTVTTENN